MSENLVGDLREALDNMQVRTRLLDMPLSSCIDSLLDIYAWLADKLILIVVRERDEKQDLLIRETHSLDMNVLEYTASMLLVWHMYSPSCMKQCD